jgi:t-SNARE complex subunit (syntaxin)
MESAKKYYSSEQLSDSDSFIQCQLLKDNVEFNEGIIQERNEAIEQIYKDVIDINEIFKDLNKLVQEQEEPIYQLETNINSSVKTTESAIKSLKQAEAYHSKWFSKRNKFILMSIAGLSINAPVTVFFGIKAGIISGLSTVGISALTSLF